MKAIIKSKSQLTLGLKQWYIFDILGDDNEVLLENQSVESTPSLAAAAIKSLVTEYEREYEKSQELEDGLEIN